VGHDCLEILKPYSDPQCKRHKQGHDAQNTFQPCPSPQGATNTTSLIYANLSYIMKGNDPTYSPIYEEPGLLVTRMNLEPRNY
jgi:hypothetical protein